MKIGLLSDTHSFLDPAVFKHFDKCDEIWHAGDIGDRAVAVALEKFKPFYAVYGNIDDRDLQTRFLENLWLDREGLQILITHIAGTPPNYNPRIKGILKEKVPDILICGHSHILRIAKDPKHHNMLYINPGAAGNHGFHHMKTLIRFDLKDRVVSNMEVIELGKRGALLPDNTGDH